MSKNRPSWLHHPKPKVNWLLAGVESMKGPIRANIIVTKPFGIHHYGHDISLDRD